MKRVLFWAVGGAVVALPFALLHIERGVIVTAKGHVDVDDWWAAPLYAAAGVWLGMGHRHVTLPITARLFGPRAAQVPPASTIGACVAVVCLVVAYASSSFVWPHHALALVAYVVAFVGAVAVVDVRARPALIVQGVGTAIVAPLIEVVLSSSGAFRYGHPDVFGVAMWLPGLYLHAGLASHVVDRRLMAA